ncbi:MAG: ABC transporter permease [Oscillospiraceae bacterium]|nr:ABC transporter permease [Oscillospiraceae bacterium]
MFLIKHFVKRLRRDGLKSLSVPLVALVLVLLINLLGAVRAELQAEYDDMMENFPILVQLSDHSGMNTSDLDIRESFMNVFIDPEHPLSLYEFTSDIALRRTLEVTSIAGEPLVALNGEGYYDSDFGGADVSFDGAYVDVAPSEIVPSRIFGVTNLSALYPLTDEPDFSITFFEGYDESVLATEQSAFLVSEHLMEFVSDNMLEVGFRSNNPAVLVAAWINDIESGLYVVGTVSGVDEDLIIGPFWTVTALGFESDDSPPYSELLHMTVADNRELSALKSVATNSFAEVRPVLSSLRFSMMIFESEFIETLEPLRQNIILVDVATPFIFIISVAVGFLTSTLLTRQRMSEYAIMRSVGVRRRGIFFGALYEQAMLSLLGAALGFLVVMFTWDYMNFERPAIFLACYIIGAVFSASRAAGTDVMAILRNRE